MKSLHHPMKYPLFSLLIIFACGGSNRPQVVSEISEFNFNLTPVTTEVTAPVYLDHANDNRLFIIEQPGKIRILKNGKLLEKPFLDISKSKVDKLSKSYSEKGLLGLAFHPQYNKNGKFFIYYSAPTDKKEMDNKSVLSEYQVSAAHPDEAGENEKIILQIEEPQSNHNGGQIAFGKDGYLYIGVGDGGGGGDKHGTIGNGQNLNSFLGKILRINVDKGTLYTVPPDNPLVGKQASPEVWAYGLRNPWRFSFDRQTNKLFCGDVGQNLYEEIDIIEKGKNYGWRAMEGNHVYDATIKNENMQTPIHDYPRSVGVCVIGGYVYRGKKYPSLLGKYFFADWSGKIFYLDQETSGKWLRYECKFNNKPAFTINSMGEDANGELYVLTQKEAGPFNPGVVYRLDLK
jgi:glucose/arabinose dehydrogenase